MRIVLLQETDWFKKGPHDQHHLAEKLSARGHEVRVIDHELYWKTQGSRELYLGRQVFSNVCRVYNGSGVTLIRPGFIKIPWLDYASAMFSHWSEIKRQVNEFRPDVFIGFGVFNSYLAMRAARERRIPFVYYWTDVWHLFAPVRLAQPLGRFIEKLTLRHADTVIATNKALKDCLLKMGACPEQTYILRKGVDFNRFDPSLDASSVRERYGFERNDIVLLFIGRLSHFSGLKEMVSRFTKVNEPRLKMMLVGDGELHRELQMIQQNYHLQERLILTGRRPYDEVPGLIAASNICLLPFHHIKATNDIVPMKMYDYLAMKKPVISTRLPGVIAEFGEDNGIIYVDKPEDIVKKALELAELGNLAQLGERARKKFIEGYSWDSITDELEKILTRTVQEKRSQTTRK